MTPRKMELGHTASERGRNTNFKKLVNESGEVGGKQRETADGDPARTVGKAARGRHVARAHLPKGHAALGGHPRTRHRWHEVRPKPDDVRLELEGCKTVPCGKQSAKDGAAGMSRVPYTVRSASKGPVLGPGAGGCGQGRPWAGRTTPSREGRGTASSSSRGPRWGGFLTS